MPGGAGSGDTATVNTRPSCTTARLRVGVSPGKRLIMGGPGKAGVVCLSVRPNASGGHKARRSTSDGWSLGDDRHDLVGRRLDDDDLIVDQDELIAAPLRIDRHDLGRQRIEV